MSAYNIGTDANPVPVSDAQFPTGSKLAQYLHGGGFQAPAKDFSRPPPSIPAPPFRIMGQAEVETSMSYPFSQMNLSGGAPTIASAGQMDGSDEDRVTAFLNGNYSSHDYFPPETEGEADAYQGCSSSYYAYQGLPSHMWKNRIKSQPVSSFFINPALKAELVARQLSLQCPSTSESFPNVPVRVEQYFNLIPLDSGIPRSSCQSSSAKPSLCDAAITYKALKSSDGLMYCLKRVPATRSFSQKQILACENWKRLSHSNIVQLKEVFQTRAFGDHSFIFVYDFHPLAETVRTFHFGREQHNMTISKTQPSQSLGVNNGLPENLVWNYIIQISSAIRYIHSCGLSIRFLDILKLLISEKSRLLLTMCGMEDVLQADNARNIVAQQVEDLRSFGLLLIVMVVGRLNAAKQENLPSSMQYVDTHASLDLKNAIHLLCGAKNIPGQRVTTINELMPMIGARFYGQIENLQTKNDFLEDELSKELECGRLFRIVCKINTVIERPGLNMDPMWSETGDRYLLKLFRDYVFHQVSENGKPWIDFSHIISSLNKLDAGVEENIQLVSRNGDNVLIVSYAELRKCLENSFTTLQQTQSPESQQQFNGATRITPEKSGLPIPNQNVVTSDASKLPTPSLVPPSS